MTKVYIQTYGCTLNQADTDMMKAILLERGYKITENEEESDAIILNTCTVKGATESKITEKIKALTAKRKKVVVAGCLTANEERIRKIAPYAPIVGTSSLKSIDSAVEAAFHEKPRVFKSFESKDALPKLITAPIMRIPINDGCTSACHFCQTKLARPFLRSYSPKTIAKWIDESIRKGAREIQLTSMDSGAYGIDLKTNLIELLKSISHDDSETVAREPFLIRLGMINPNHAYRMRTDLILALKHPRFYKFLHLPVQAGSERVCNEMNRDHGIREFVEVARDFRNEFPEGTLATDIIVGYPTETESDFEETMELLRTIRPDVTNVSKFSPRPGTEAKKLKQLNTEELKRRSMLVSALAKKISGERNRECVGKIYRVLVIEKAADFKARNENYKQVVIKDFEGKRGDVVEVKIYNAKDTALFGKLI